MWCGSVGHSKRALESPARPTFCSSVVLGLDGHPIGYAMMVPTVSTTSAPVPRVMVSFASLFSPLAESGVARGVGLHGFKSLPPLLGF